MSCCTWEPVVHFTDRVRIPDTDLPTIDDPMLTGRLRRVFAQNIIDEFESSCSSLPCKLSKRESSSDERGEGLPSEIAVGFQTPNPKKRGSRSWERYEIYMHARTLQVLSLFSHSLLSSLFSHSLFSHSLFSHCLPSSLTLSLSLSYSVSVSLLLCLSLSLTLSLSLLLCLCLSLLLCLSLSYSVSLTLSLSLLGSPDAEP